MDDKTTITQEPLIAAQIINKLLQGNPQGVTINVISIGTVTVQNGHKDERMLKTDNRVQQIEHGGSGTRYRHTTRDDLVKALIQSNWRAREAAKLLELSYATMQQRLRLVGGIHKLKEELEKIR
jgi:transcriptional regulator of acetoin/glycerol metabolism